MRVSDFYYELPSDRIAQEPLADRAGVKLLQLNRTTGALTDRQFREFPSLLQPDDLLVLNNTRVFPARLYGRRAGTKSQPVSRRNPTAPDFLSGRIEVLLTRRLSEDPNEWECLVRPGRKIGVGERLFFGKGDELQAQVTGRGGFGERRIRFSPIEDFASRLERVGHVPLPPYIGRADCPQDHERYQTIYAKYGGSVAAPTAGLHFTRAILDEIRARGIQIAEITLHVGLGTFQPVRVKNVEDHRLHSEAYDISAGAADLINSAIAESRRVIAVGTTTVRTLEFAAQVGDGKVTAGKGEADIFIYPGYKFRLVQGMLTNFHLPQSTLLMLVSAFAGRASVLNAYRHAVRKGYRFYSYGDCMLIE